jgi:alkylated DNA repair dioxygenase AlkB
MAGLLGDVPWEEEEIFLHGRMVKSPRLTAWYGDPGASYMYSGVPHEPMEWTPELSAIRELVSSSAQVSFNSVLLNLYRDGSDSVSWHSDDEEELGAEPTIASMSLGATRRFRLRERRTRESLGLDLADGSLLLMSGASQRDWEHCLTKTKRAVGPRINLTFRVVRVSS